MKVEDHTIGQTIPTVTLGKSGQSDANYGIPLVLFHTTRSEQVVTTLKSEASHHHTKYRIGRRGGLHAAFGRSYFKHETGITTVANPTVEANKKTSVIMGAKFACF